jgi:transposase
MALAVARPPRTARGEPFEEVDYDKPREGRPSELSEEEHELFVEALHKSPEEVGFDAPAWSVPLASAYLREEFDIEYCRYFPIN